VALAVLRALLATGAPEGPVAIGGPEVHDWNEVAEALGEAVGRHVRLVRVPRLLFLTAGSLAEVAAELLRRAPEMDRRRARDLTRLSWTCDLGPAERAIGWMPSVELRRGLAETAHWYREVGWLRP
jgi:nucleoside-diphosphate-sugar epimerase